MGEWARLVLVLLAAAGVLVLGAAYGMARLLLRPPRMTDGKAAWVLKRLSPGDLGIPYQPVEFQVRDERSGKRVRLAGWWMGQAAGRCVVLVHGYADAKVGAIAWAPVLWERKWNILAIDLRAHGESDGKLTTGGYAEREDLRQVLNEMRARWPEQTERLALFGISLGGAVVAAAAEGREDVAAVVMESPFTDFGTGATTHFEAMGLWGGWVQRLALRMAERLAGADWGSVAPLETIRGVRCPVMVIHCAEDPFVRAGALDAFSSLLSERKDESVHWVVPDCGHLMGMPAGPLEYARRVGDFLEAAASGR